MARTLAEIQRRLNMSGLGIPQLVVDGEKGPATSAAVVAFQKKAGIKETGIVDAKTLSALFPDEGFPTTETKTVLPTLNDWILNTLTSKVTWASSALVGALVAFLAARGFNLDPQVQVWLISGVTIGLNALIVLIRGRFDSPRVANKTPAVIQRPMEYQK